MQFQVSTSSMSLDDMIDPDLLSRRSMGLAALGPHVPTVGVRQTSCSEKHRRKVPLRVTLPTPLFTADAGDWGPILARCITTRHWRTRSSLCTSSFGLDAQKEFLHCFASSTCELVFYAEAETAQRGRLARVLGPRRRRHGD